MQQNDPVYLERWAAMYTLASSIPNDIRFDMQHWAKPNRSSECGTSACMAGHAILHPWFIERGFSLTAEDTDTQANKWYGLDLRSHDASFWGLDRLGINNPFDPEHCEHELDFQTYDSDNGDYRDLEYDPITPTEAAYVVRQWMVEHWGASATDEAIAKSTVTYSADYVHQNAPWLQQPKEGSTDVSSTSE